MRQPVIALLLFAATASAQDAYLAHLTELRSHQPNDVRFQISLPKTEFYIGELVPLQLSFSANAANAYTADTRLQDRIGRLNGEEEFLVDPVALTEDPLQGLQGQGGGMGGIFGGPVTLSEKPFKVDRLLNDWVRFRQPGRFRIAILSRRVKNVQLVSNVLTINILPAPAIWVSDRIAEAVDVLDGPPDVNDQTYQQRRLQAAQTLRHLGTLQSALALSRYLGTGNSVDAWTIRMGLVASPYRTQLLSWLETRLTAPDQPVTSFYLNTLQQLSNGNSNTFVDRVAASLPDKQPEARAISIDALPDSAVSPAVATLLTADFLKLSRPVQTTFLEYRWSLIRRPEMLPVLREIYKTMGPLQDVAARRIYDLAPEEGRGIILSQIAEPGANLTMKTLTMLPDAHLPELDEVLARRMEAHQYVDTVILRYTTGDIVKRVEQAYLARNKDLDRQKLPHCGGALVFYFLQHDVAFGERELRNEMDQPAAFPACYDMAFQFQDLGRWAYSPALEKLAIEFLSSPKVPVKRGAAELLGMYGSPAAEKPLWDTMEFFHSWWKGREKELLEPENQEGLRFEVSLRTALAKADGWKLDTNDMNRLLDLCTSEWCKRDVHDWMAR